MKKMFFMLAIAAATMFAGCEPEKDEVTNNNGGSGNQNGGGNTEIAPQADFSFSGTSNYPPCTIAFTNKSKNASYYSWDFGDGKTSTQTSPSHQYSNGGIYTVTLRASGSGGDDVITKTVNIKQKPTKMKITKVILRKYPQMDSNGENWDYMSGPDIFFKITCGSSTLVTSGKHKDATYNDLPITYTNNLPITIDASFDKQCEIDFYDYDDYDPNDWMGGYYFTPSKKNFNSGVIHFSSSTSELELDMYVEWLQ